MATVTFWVEKIIEEKPYVAELLKEGLINNAALAESLIPELEEKLKKRVKFSAVNMAIRRLSEELERKRVENPISFAKDSDISLKSNLISFVIENKKGIALKLKELYSRICSDRKDFIVLAQGLEDIMITTNESYSKELESLFSGVIIKRIGGLAGISIEVPRTSLETVGYIYTLGKLFALNNINIINLVYTYDGIVFIVREEDATKTFDMLRRLIKENSNNIKN